MKSIKKRILAALICIAGLLTVCAAAADAAPREERGYVPIIMYHEVKPRRPGKDAIYPEELRADLEYLKANGYTAVTIEDLIAYCGGGTLPEKCVVLSFDDGYLNNYLYAVPLMEEYGMKMVLSVIGSNADDFTQYPSDNVDYAHMTWAQLKELSDSGRVEIQNHSYGLHSLGARRGCAQMAGESDSAYEEFFAGDVMYLQEEMAAELGKTPTAFAYPYGIYSDLSEGVLMELGFKATLTCDYGVNVLTGDPEELFGLKRICRSHGDNMGKLLEKAMKTVS